MAQIKNPRHGTGPVNAGEARLLKWLEVKLPDDYIVIPNFKTPVMVRPNVTQMLEFDCLVVSPHALYHIENKDFAARIEADDDSWYMGEKVITNPLNGADYKSKKLLAKIVHQNAAWRDVFPRGSTLVTLSHPGQSLFGFDPHSDCRHATFLLDDRLIDFLTSPEMLGRRQGQIREQQEALADYLAGISKNVEHQRTHIHGYKIITELDQCDDYTEYLVEKTSVLGDKREYRLKEYPLDVAGLSPIQLEQHRLKVNNGNIAQEKIGTSPFILPSHYALNSEETVLYEISENLSTRSLKMRMKISTMTLMSKVKIVSDIAQALKAAHTANEKPVIHRNVTPENICVLPDGNAVLCNFSLAWYQEHSTAAGGFTVRTKVMKASEHYLPPEFEQGRAEPQSDIFSLGVVAYELFTGKLPFESMTMYKALGGLQEENLPTKVVPDLPEWVDGMIRQMLALDLDDRFASAEELIDYINRNAFNAASSSGGNDAPKRQKSLREMKVGDMVTPGVQLYEELGKGGFGRVFKAKNTVNGRYFAIKLFDYSPTAIQDVISEYNALSAITHPNVVRIYICDKSLDGLFYTQMELLEGDNLGAYSKGDLRLPLPEIYKMAEEILQALTHMQEMEGGPVIHRDIKPNNIVWDKKRRYVLIDFNIATDDAANQDEAGTRPYMAPDLWRKGGKVAWDRSADTFSLGVTLYELLTHTYPWPGSDPCPRMNIPATPIKSVSTIDFSDEFAELIMRSIITDSTKRYGTAREMLEALQAIGPEGLLRKAPSTGVIFVDNHGEETDIVGYLNSLYSQSEHGNSGTRAATTPSRLDEITYTETKLDKKLLRDIADLRYKLVIVTGNAGDGKTAFLHKVEEQGTDKETLTNRNGAKFRVKGVPFESNYDGSQDEEEKANDEVLRDFFQPFMDLTDYTEATEGRVIAINEGRLVDFLSTQPGLKALQENIEEFFYEEGHAELLPGVMVINLNLRSVTAREPGHDSLLKSQVKKLTRKDLWAKCERCPIADRCFIKYNVDTLNDESAGDEVINRLEWLLRTIVYKRELHVTMRDLRSLISYLITRDYNCEQVKQLLAHIEADTIAPEFYWQFYYFNVTAPAFHYNGYFPFPTNESGDRLVKMLKETDLARVALPSLDRDLYYNQKDETDYLTFASRKRSLLDEMNRCNRLRPYYDMSEDDKFLLRERHASMVRHQYFEGQFRGGTFMRRLPYSSLTRFFEHLRGGSDANAIEEAKRNIAQAISRSEGCLNDELSSSYMLLACSHVSDPISKSYRMFPLDDFELFVNETPRLTEYIEYESDSLTFRHREDHSVKLTVTLDLFEMLDYIERGFNPSVNDLQGRFIELQIFKNRLESKTYKEILVTKNNRKFSVVRLNDDKTLTIAPYNPAKV